MLPSARQVALVVTYLYAPATGLGPVTGEIVMSDELPMSGVGASTQVVSDGIDLWGGWRVTVNKDRGAILIDNTYTGGYSRGPPEEIAQGYVWTQTERCPDVVSRVWAIIAP